MRRRFLGAGLASLIALGLAWSGLSTVASDWWLARDDAVITFSHARNLIEFGTVGVSPGDRVEGFSSPLQFLLSAGLLAVHDFGFDSLSLVILAVSLAITGAMTFVFYDGVSRRAGLGARAVPLVTALATVVFLAGITSHWTVIGWVASGMENAPALALLVAVAATYPLLRRGGIWPVVPSLALGLLAITRVEFAAFLAPLLVLFVLELRESAPDAHTRTAPTVTRVQARRVRMVAGLAPALGLIATVHVARRLHFGAWLPNTAVVQDRFDGPWQLLLLVSLSGTMTAAVVLVRGRTGSNLRWIVIGLGALSIIGYSWMSTHDLTAMSTRQLLDVPGDFPGLALALGLGVVLTWLQGRIGRVDRSTLAVLWALLFIPVAQFLVMGRARMEPFRVLSLALPIALLWLGVCVVGLSAVALARDGDRSNDSRRALAGGLAGAVWLVVLGAGLSGLVLDRPRDLPWNIAGYTTIEQAAARFRDANLSSTSLPIVANPDLGKLSFQKEVLMVDLGLLGDPLLTDLWKKDPNLAIEYVVRIARPDVLELHGGWSCSYRGLFSAEFLDAYRPTNDRWTRGTELNRGCPFGGRYIVWELNATEEHVLTRRISEDPDPVTLITRSLSGCAASGADPLRCQPVRRAVQRSIVDLQRRGRWDAAIDAFRASPTASLDEELLRRQPGWSSRAAREISSILRGG
ncbi:MAG: hypothetical protein FGM58_05535 [Acidimicrobiia bacterium]|nr:hypothetical protein [Acidimicrobiia bacterium]